MNESFLNMLQIYKIDNKKGVANGYVYKIDTKKGVANSCNAKSYPLKIAIFSFSSYLSFSLASQ